MNNELLSLIQEIIKDQTLKTQQTIVDTALYEQNRVAIYLLKRAVEESADYAEKNMSEAIVFTNGNKRQMWNCAISKLKIDGHIAEFGVFEGDSINYLADLIFPKTIFGFDSFLGLEEDFSLDYPKGGFNKNGEMPLVKNNVSLIKGSFSDTLPEWLNKNSKV